MENPHLWPLFPGKQGIFHGYVYWRVNWDFIWSERLRLATHLPVLKLIFGTWRHDERNLCCLMANRSRKAYIVLVRFFSQKDMALQLAARWRMLRLHQKVSQASLNQLQFFKSEWVSHSQSRVVYDSYGDFRCASSLQSASWRLKTKRSAMCLPAVSKEPKPAILAYQLSVSCLHGVHFPSQLKRFVIYGDPLQTPLTIPSNLINYLL